MTDARIIATLQDLVRDVKRIADYKQIAMRHAVGELEVAGIEMVRRARDLHAGDECQIEDGALKSEAMQGTWVQAWVFVPHDDDEDSVE